MLHIKKVAILGTSPMAAQIAAHFVNAGLDVFLYDQTGSTKNKNLLVKDAISGLKTLKPTPLLKASYLKYIKAANYDDDMEKLGECDLIIESIPDQLEWKADLYKKIAPYISSHAILASNTSNFTITELAEHIPKKLLSRFCGVHFFNPPRFLPLVELIAHKKTDTQLLAALENFLIIHLGKYIIRAKDTPCFVGNRIGVFALLTALKYAEKFDLRLDVVDKLTGPLVGHAKSATMGALDLVGLDTFATTVRSLQQRFHDDPWYESFKIPDYIQQLIDTDRLGLKSGMGIYKYDADGRYIYDLKDGSYRPVTGQVNKEVLSILAETDVKKRFKRLRQCKIPDARFLCAYYRDIWQYCAYHLESLANTVRDIDDVMRWGFAWSHGPFELWQNIGWEDVTKAINEEITSGEAEVNVPLPDWVGELGVVGCYKGEDGYNPKLGSYQAQRQLPIYQKLKPSFKSKLYEDDAVVMRVDDNVAVLSFKTKMAICSQDVLYGIRKALPIAEQQSDALVIWQEKSENFSVGADLLAFKKIIKENNFSLFEERLKNIQTCCMALRYAQVPSVAALRGYVLGGGAELAMHCTSRVAHIETQMGLVESTIGLLPAGGGCKEMVLRASEKAGSLDIMQWLQQYFVNLSRGSMSNNAVLAKEMGFLQEADVLIMNPAELLYAAKLKANSLASDGYVPPRKPEIRVVGNTGWAQMTTALINQHEGGFISEHHYIVAHHIAKILSGGIVEADSMVTEEWLLRLEREAFLELIKMPETAACIEKKLK